MAAGIIDRDDELNDKRSLLTAMIFNDFEEVTDCSSLKPLAQAERKKREKIKVKNVKENFFIKKVGKLSSPEVYTSREGSFSNYW